MAQTGDDNRENHNSRIARTRRQQELQYSHASSMHPATFFNGSYTINAGHINSLPYNPHPHLHPYMVPHVNTGPHFFHQQPPPNFNLFPNFQYPEYGNSGNDFHCKVEQRQLHMGMYAYSKNDKNSFRNVDRLPRVENGSHTANEPTLGRKFLFTAPKSEKVIVDLTTEDDVNPVKSEKVEAPANDLVIKKLVPKESLPSTESSAGPFSQSSSKYSTSAMSTSAKRPRKMSFRNSEANESTFAFPVSESDSGHCKLCLHLVTPEEELTKYSTMLEKRTHAKQHSAHGKSNWRAFMKKCFGISVTEPTENVAETVPEASDSYSESGISEYSDCRKSDAEVPSKPTDCWAFKPHEQLQCFPDPDEQSGSKTSGESMGVQAEKDSSPVQMTSPSSASSFGGVVGATSGSSRKLAYQVPENAPAKQPLFPRRLKAVMVNYLPKYTHPKFKCKSCQVWVSNTGTCAMSQHIRSHLPAGFPLYSCGYCGYQGKDAKQHWHRRHSGAPFIFTDNSAFHDDRLVKVLEECFGGDVEDFSESIVQAETVHAKPPQNFLNLLATLDRKTKNTCVPCGLCEKTVKSCSIRSHVYTHVNKLKIYRCRKCEEMLTYGNVTDHMIKHGTKRTKLTVQDLRYQHEEQLINVLHKCFSQFL